MTPDEPLPAPLGQERETPPDRARRTVWSPETAPMTLMGLPADVRSRYGRRRQFRISRTEQVNEAVDVALRLGAVLLSGGARTDDVEGAVFAAATALGLQRFDVDVTSRAITVSVSPAPQFPGLTSLRVVRKLGHHHARLAAAHELVLDLTAGVLTRESLLVRLDEVESTPRPYPRWFVTLAWGVLAASLVVRLGGGWLTALIAFASAAVVDRVGRGLKSLQAPRFFFNATGALIATSVAVAMTSLELESRSSLVVAGGIIALLPGMALVVAVREAMGDFPLTAAARIVELAVATSGVVAGVLGGLLLAGQLGITMVVVEPDVQTLGSATVAVIAGGVAAAASAVGHHSLPRMLLATGAGGAAGLAVAKAVVPIIQTPGVAEAAAAVLIGVLAVPLAARLRIPTVLLIAPATIPLLPGQAIYRGLLALSQGEMVDGGATLLGAGAVAVGLAAGVVLGELIGMATFRGARVADQPPQTSHLPAFGDETAVAESGRAAPAGATKVGMLVRADGTGKGNGPAGLGGPGRADKSARTGESRAAGAAGPTGASGAAGADQRAKQDAPAGPGQRAKPDATAEPDQHAKQGGPAGPDQHAKEGGPVGPDQHAKQGRPATAEVPARPDAGPADGAPPEPGPADAARPEPGPPDAAKPVPGPADAGSRPAPSTTRGPVRSPILPPRKRKPNH